jgi:hypothetical protein
MFSKIKKGYVGDLAMDRLGIAKTRLLKSVLKL